MADPGPLVDHVYDIRPYLHPDDSSDDSADDSAADSADDSAADSADDSADEFDSLSSFSGSISSFVEDKSLDLLELLYTESQVKLPGDPRHNNNMYYYDHRNRSDNSDDSDGGEEEKPRDPIPIAMASKLYEFCNVKKDIECDIKQGEKATELPDCSIRIYYPNKAMTNRLLSICQRISLRQSICDLYLSDVTCASLPEPRVFNISSNVRSLKIKNCTLPVSTFHHLIEQIGQWTKLHMKNVEERDGKAADVELMSVDFKPVDESSVILTNCTLSDRILNRLMQQIPGSNTMLGSPNTTTDLPTNNTRITHFNLRDTQLPEDVRRRIYDQLNGFLFLVHLDLSGNVLTGYLSRFLTDTQPGSSALEVLSLRSTEMNEVDMLHFSHILQRNKLLKLQVLDLSYNTLAGCLSNFIQDPHHGLPELFQLNLDSTALNKDDLQHLSYITQKNKLPKLRNIHLSKNTLTGLLSNFLPDTHSGLLSLEKLWLSDTHPNEEDAKHMLHMLQKLPKLQELYLNSNTLTGLLSNFLPDGQLGLPELVKLDLAHTELSKEDLMHLTWLIQFKKISGLHELDLHGNNFSEIEEELGELIESCVTFHPTDLELDLCDGNLSEGFQYMWIERETESVKLIFWEKRMKFFGHGQSRIR